MCVNKKLANGPKSQIVLGPGRYNFLFIKDDIFYVLCHFRCEISGLVCVVPTDVLSQNGLQKETSDSVDLRRFSFNNHLLRQQISKKLDHLNVRKTVQLYGTGCHFNIHLTLGCVVETRDEDVAHHEVDEPDAASSGAYGKTITI